MNAPRNLTATELSDLLTGLIPNVNQRTCSISRFCKEHKALLQNMRNTKQPLLLRDTGGLPIALVFDLQEFWEIEKRRKRLVDILRGLETEQFQRPTATKKEIIVNPLAECFRKAEELRHRISQKERERQERQAKLIDPLILETAKAKEELERVEAEQLSLLDAWEKSKAPQQET